MSDALKEKLNALCFIEFELGTRFEARMPLCNWETFKRENETEYLRRQTLIDEILELCKTQPKPPQP